MQTVLYVRILLLSIYFLLLMSIKRSVVECDIFVVVTVSRLFKYFFFFKYDKKKIVF